MRYRVSHVMDEIWERAVETALEGSTDPASTRTLTLDGVVKCVQGRLPPWNILERFQNLQHLSIANIGVSSLEQFPRLPNLQRLILSDNRIAGGLECLVQAGLECLRDLDLSNNRIQFIEDLAPLAELRLVSLDLYECPVTRVKDYRSRVFGLIKSLKYLDKMDAEGNERPESDDDEEDEEGEEEGEDDEEDDPGSGEVDGEDRGVERVRSNGSVEGVVDVDEDDGSDADEEETEVGRRENGSVDHHGVNGYRFEAVDGEEVEEDDDGEGDEEDEADDTDSGEEIDDEEGDDDDVVEVHEIEDSDDDDGVEDEEDDDDEEDEEVDNEDGDFAEPDSTGRLLSTEGEIDGHEQGEDDGDEDDIGETGEEEQGVEEFGGFEDEDDCEDEEEDSGDGYLVQPVARAEEEDIVGSDMDAGNDEEDAEEVEEVEDEEDIHEIPPSSSGGKRKRDEGDADDGEDEEEEDDVLDHGKSSKKQC